MKNGQSSTASVSGPWGFGDNSQSRQRLWAVYRLGVQSVSDAACGCSVVLALYPFPSLWSQVLVRAGASAACDFEGGWSAHLRLGAAVMVLLAPGVFHPFDPWGFPFFA